MQTSIDYEQIVLNNLRQLSPTQQQEVVNFTEFLRQKFTQASTGSMLSLQQLAKLPVNERHQHLKVTIAATLNDFLTDPELTEFSVLDGEDWEIEHD
jgi:ABC-type transporter MlaC component